MEFRKIRKEEIIELQKISSLAFNWSFDKNGKTDEEYIDELTKQPTDKWAACWQDHWGAFTEDNKLVSSISVIDYKVFFDGTIQDMKGIGGVCTYPNYRRNGSIREMMKLILSELYENGIAFSYLYPFSEEFYGRFGYMASCRKIKWSFDLKKIPVNTYQGHFYLYQGEEDNRDFETAYQTYAKQLNLMIDRTRFDWKVLKNADPFKTNTQAYLYKNTEGIPSGYIIFSREDKDNQTIYNCSELVFDNFETLKAIMSFVASFSSHCQLLYLYAPEYYPLEYFCTDYAQSRSSRSIEQNGMVRVVNAVKVLENAKYRGTGSLIIKISDDFLPMNNKTYEVTYEDNKAVSVRETDEKADAEFRINEFSAAIAGNYDVSDFDYMEHVQLNCDKEKAAKVFYRKPYWINNYF